MRVTMFTLTADCKRSVSRHHTIADAAQAATATHGRHSRHGAPVTHALIYRDPFPDSTSDAPTLRVITRGVEPLHVWHVLGPWRSRAARDRCVTVRPDDRAVVIADVRGEVRP